jgi:hypothetical protein
LLYAQSLFEKFLAVQRQQSGSALSVPPTVKNGGIVGSGFKGL